MNRYWIIAGSTLSPLHKFDGQVVLWDGVSDRVYPIHPYTETVSFSIGANTHLLTRSHVYNPEHQHCYCQRGITR